MKAGLLRLSGSLVIEGVFVAATSGKVAADLLAGGRHEDWGASGLRLLAGGLLALDSETASIRFLRPTGVATD